MNYSNQKEIGRD